MDAFPGGRREDNPIGAAVTYSVVNTQEWSWEQLAPYTRDITAAMRLLAERFPEDVTVQSLGQDIVTGLRQLWLILEGDRFVSFCLTNVRTIDATGVKVVTLTTHAGEAGIDCVPQMCAVIEAWAKEQGAQFTAAEGRRGWARALAKQGYREHAVIFRKPVGAD